MSDKFQLVIFAVLAAGVLAAWARSGNERDAKAPRGRLQQLGWLLALALLTASAIATLSSTLFWPTLQHSNHVSLSPRVEQLTGPGLGLAVVIAVAVALLLALRPGLAKPLVPAGLILLGLAGYVLIRTWFDSGSAIWYGVTEVARTTVWGGKDITVHTFGGDGDAVILAQAWLFLLLGGWLGWRELRDHPAAARLLLGEMSAARSSGQPWGLLLLAPILALAELAARPWWSVPLLAVSVLVIRRWPQLAGQVAAAGVVAVGLLSVAQGLKWSDGGLLRGFMRAARAVPPHVGWSYALRPVQELVLTHAAETQGVILIGLGCWLVPQVFPAVGQRLGLAPHADLTERVRRLTESRAVVVDTAASDLRRLERDLHDGAQARLVALGMNLRAAERLIPVNPDAAVALVAEARDTSALALTELRELVRGVHPPVLADRGLADAIRALALDCPLAVETSIELPGRPPAPVETACYFAVAELLTNAAKHSGARAARVDISHRDRLLRIEVTDFGLGGADPVAGSGLTGVEKRLATFDGIMAVSSPPGGPTIVALEVPCVLSSLKGLSC